MKSGGTEALTRQGGPGRPSKLSASELSQLRGALIRKPAEVDLGPGGWSLKLIAKYILKNFGAHSTDGGQ